MNVITELKYYCKKENPTGTIMLTGEWGVGKTYFIEKIFKEEIKNEFVVIRISLFGVDSIDNMHKAVKQAWIEAYIEEIGKTKVHETWKLCRWIFKKFNISETLNQLMNIDVTDVLFINKIINKKKVILVFDDLERSKLNVVDLLGCINDYCENRKFHTIIISNESKIEQLKMKDSAQSLKYYEIKEKIVQKTIKYQPDYKVLIQNIIDEIQADSQEYIKLLRRNSQVLTNMFSEDGNIRSLKCALQDFERIYTILNKERIDKINKYLLAFVSLVLFVKSNITETKELITELEKKYGNWFESQYLLKAEKNWIVFGEWDEQEFYEELKLVLQVQEVYAKGMLQKNHLLDMDEDKLERDFEYVLGDAYNGKLSLTEYLLLISNLSKMRQYEYHLYDCVDWELIKKGIDLRKQYSFENQVYSVDIQDNFDTAEFNTEEKLAYSDILKFCQYELKFMRGKNAFLNNIRENTYASWYNCKKIKSISFDKEMADKTLQYFSEYTNQNKNLFISEFIEYWELCLKELDFNCKESLGNFVYLIDMLNVKKENSYKNGRRIESVIIGEYIVNLENIVYELKKASIVGS